MTNTLVPLGNYPDVVYRVFTEREHVQQFIDGNIRLGNIYYYKKVEDAKRRDKTEGESHVVHEGVSKHGMFAYEFDLYSLLPQNFAIRCKVQPR